MNDTEALSTYLPTPATSVVCGTAFHSPVLGQVEVLRQHLFCFDEEGTITGILCPEHPNYRAVRQRSQQTGTYTALPGSQYLLPGFVDLHVHASQWPQSGKALDRPVMEWLNDYTIPLETRFENSAFAEKVYQEVVPALLANGTTTAMYFATVHKDATLRLAEICQEHGQRALVGKVVMDNQWCPATYKDASPASALADTEWLIKAIRALPDNLDLVWPVITPRFIPNCSDQVLMALGSLAQASNVHVQTHCSESDWVHQHVIDRMGKSDARSLADFGLLTRRSILAHANFLSADDTELIQHKGSSVAHCPISNVFFANSVLPVAEHLRQGTNIGLGTDIAGGYSPSMFDAIRQSIMSSKMLEDGVDPEIGAAQRGRANSCIDFREAFWLATTGGGLALDLPIGYFRAGRKWDAQALDIAAPDSNISRYDELDTDTDMLQKILINAQRCNVDTVWVNGKVVHKNSYSGGENS